ncbi:hypothetical protein RLIN73S_02182 [Rhodanobacter lindaniclasticus]
MNIPAYQVRPADAIALTEARSQLRVQEAATVFDTMDLRPVWVEVDSKKFEGTFKSGRIAVTCRPTSMKIDYRALLEAITGALHGSFVN